ncbi:MAG: glycosyltransferase [Chloroflexia bacterium]
MKPLLLDHQLGIAAFLGVLLLVVLSNALALRRVEAYPLPARFLRVSILLPVRNERQVVADCVKSLLAQDYPDYEVLVFDDGSTDGTGPALAGLAEPDGRLRVLQGRPLPEGWLGKHWACQQLAEAATGELLLFTDADTVHHPHALRSGVAALLAEGADLLSGFLHQKVVTWGERLTVPTAFWCFFSFLPLPLAHRVRLPELSLTNGQWMLFRRTAYEAVGGHAAVRDNPVDDIALGRRVKARGLRWRVVDLGAVVSCRMYRSAREAVEGFSKNLFAAFDFRVIEYLFVWLWLLLLGWEPLVTLAMWRLGLGERLVASWPAAVAVAEMGVIWWITLTRLRFPRHLVFLYPVGILCLVLIAFRSLWLTVTGRAQWKGRLLPRQRVRWL